jgi:hypothetical protein
MVFQLFLKGLEGKTSMLQSDDLGPNTTVKDLRKLVKEKTGVAEDDQRLLYAGKQMEDICYKTD